MAIINYLILISSVIAPMIATVVLLRSLQAIKEQQQIIHLKVEKAASQTNNADMAWHASLPRVDQRSSALAPVAQAQPEQSLHYVSAQDSSDSLEVQRLRESEAKMQKDLLHAQETLARAKQFVDLYDHISTTDWRVALDSLCILASPATGPEHEVRLVRFAAGKAQEIRETINELEQNPTTFNVALHHHAQVTNFTRLPAWSGMDARCRALEALLSWIRYCAVEEIASKTMTRFQDPVLGDQFISEIHEEVGSVPTEDRELNGKIAECMHPGFSPKLKARVRRFSFQSAPLNPAPLDENNAAPSNFGRELPIPDETPKSLETEGISMPNYGETVSPQSRLSDQQSMAEGEDSAEFRADDDIPD